MASIDEEIKSAFANDKHRFIINLVFTSNWFQNKAANHLKPYGISMQQFNVLRILRGAGDWKNMNAIKALMVDKTPNTTRLSDKLLSKGYVERQRSEEDRRIVFLRITDAGLKLLETLDDSEDKEHLEFLDRITDEEAMMMSDILDRIRG